MSSNKDSSSQSQDTNLPSRLPPTTGNLLRDSVESAKHVSDLPCARNALLAGIASGAGMGFIRGLSTGPMMAGHWAIAAFTIVSLGSWHICQKQFSDERKKLARIVETTLPKRTLSESSRPNSDSNTTGSTPSP